MEGHYHSLIAKMNFVEVNGNAPINVDFELEKPLNKKLKQEFLRI